jgi:Tfp pilus assembly protein PilX
MDLPRKQLRSPKGQILILFLLVLVVGLAIVLSVASRTITDIRTTTTSDESNRAYFAAEAGIEEALQQLESTGSITGGTFPTTTVNAQATTTDITSITSTAGGIETFVYPENVAKDDVAQVMMVSDADGNGQIDFADIGGGAWSGSNLTIYWGSNAGNNQAVEVSVVYYDGAFKITKFGLDPGIHGNNFCDQSSGVTPIPGGLNITDSISEISKTVFFSADVNLRAADPVIGCPDGKQGDGITANPVLLRIRTLYNSDPMPVAIESTVAGVDLPVQGNVIVSTGQTSSGVTRKLRVIRLYTAMSSLFDYVLFSGATLTK